MRLSPPLLAALLVLTSVACASAETNAPTFTVNLSLGARGPEVLALQKALNQDPATRVASSGPGSPGNETDYFGPLTRAAVIRFQEKYAGDVLAPVGLAKGSGYAGPMTRTKLNTLAMNAGAVSATTTTTVATSSPTDYLVKDTEKTDIFAGDKMLANIQTKIWAKVNEGIEASVASQTATPITLPSITTADMPSVTVGVPTPRSALPGTPITIKGAGISTNSVVYFGDTYIVRTVSKDSLGNYSFIVPPIPPARYDIAVRTGGAVSNTTPFVITDAKNPPVHITSVSPATVSYGGTLTITGSGFSKENNLVVTTYQTFANVVSADGTTLTVSLAPLGLETYANVVGDTVTIPMSVYVVSDYGFSDTTKSFIMTL